MEERVAKLEVRADSVDQRLERIETKIDSMAEKINQIAAAMPSREFFMTVVGIVLAVALAIAAITFQIADYAAKQAPAPQPAAAVAPPQPTVIVIPGPYAAPAQGSAQVPAPVPQVAPPTTPSTPDTAGPPVIWISRLDHPPGGEPLFPSPLVGEGAARSIDREAGEGVTPSTGNVPLTRLDLAIARSAPPSPTRGEGEESRPHQSESL